MRAVINGEWTDYSIVLSLSCSRSRFVSSRPKSSRSQFSPSYVDVFFFLTKKTKRNPFCPFIHQNDENTFGFETPSKSACKSLYKCCSQHLAFFRLVQMSGPLLTSATITATTGNQNNNSIGSKFLKLSGAAAPSTATTTTALGQQSHSPPQFRRMPSRRHQRRIVDGASHRKFFKFIFLFIPSVVVVCFFFVAVLSHSFSFLLTSASSIIHLAILQKGYTYNHFCFCFLFGLPLSFDQLMISIFFFLVLLFLLLFLACLLLCSPLGWMAGNMRLYLSDMFSPQLLGSLEDVSFRNRISIPYCTTRGRPMKTTTTTKLRGRKKKETKTI